MNMTCDYLRTYIHACVFNKDNGWHTDYRFVCTISMNMADCIVHMKLAFNQRNAVCCPMSRYGVPIACLLFSISLESDRLTPYPQFH